MDSLLQFYIYWIPRILTAFLSFNHWKMPRNELFWLKLKLTIRKRDTSEILLIWYFRIRAGIGWGIRSMETRERPPWPTPIRILGKVWNYNVIRTSASTFSLLTTPGPILVVGMSRHVKDSETLSFLHKGSSIIRREASPFFPCANEKSFRIITKSSSLIIY